VKLGVDEAHAFTSCGSTALPNVPKVVWKHWGRIVFGGGEGSERQTQRRSEDVVVTKLPGARCHGGRWEAPRIDPHVKGAGS
jgi:hypothetical protein